tara:strand:- start:356 stop:1186 length:831 start_codon:yes stop_codon:yes gene_type:complete
MAISMLMPFSMILSGATLTVLILKASILKALFQCIVAMVFLIILGFFLNFGIVDIATNSFLYWLPVIFITLIYKKNSSFTLTVQLLSIISIIFLIYFFIVVGQPDTFWSEILNNLSTILTDSGLRDEALLIQNQMNLIIEQISSIIAVMIWSSYVFILAFGLNIYNSDESTSNSLDSFSDLNLGKFIAVFAALCSLSLFFADIYWLKNLTYMLLLFFWLQGLAVIHWFRNKRIIPRFLLVIIYVLLPVFNVLIVMLLAVVGYTDAWFNFRSRIKTI